MSKTASTNNGQPLKSGPLNIYKYRWVYLGISLLFLIPGIFFIISNMTDPQIGAPVRLGIDFRGGTMIEYGFSKPVSQPDIANIRTVFDEHGYTGSVIQIQQPRVGINKKAVEIGAPSQSEAKTAEQAVSTQGSQQTPKVVKTQPEPAVQAQPVGEATPNIATIVSVRTKHIQGHADQEILKDLQAKYGPITVLQKNSIGPALANELLVNGFLALLMAYVLIVGYLTFRFQFDFAICAVAALLHDTLFLFGMFAMFGALFHTEVDSLFVTALLTAVGFSVHDTIVVFDRIRENNRIYFTKKVPFVDIVNASVNQTLARSINTSLTALLTLTALYLWGGETTRDFVLAIIIGIAAGTYSSIFNASVLLAMWRNRNQQLQTASAAA
ncbi:MAG TPA: protein translocase subunit SecF [Coleofasciculaceae cyanobacterium]|jgi:preprotein translocase subunit SecF